MLHDGVRVIMRPVSCAGVIHRGDLVIFRTGAHGQPVIKIAKGLPGDHFAVDSDGFIIISGAVLKNSMGAPYDFPPTARRILQSYERAYNGILPVGTYLLLGDGAQGALDSSRLGLIHVSDFLMVGAD